VAAAFYFGDISKQADTLRDQDSPVAIYSEDVTELVIEARARLSDGAEGLMQMSEALQGQDRREYDEYAYVVDPVATVGAGKIEVFQRLERSSTFELSHSVKPGLGVF